MLALAGDCCRKQVLCVVLAPPQLLLACALCEQAVLCLQAGCVCACPLWGLAHTCRAAGLYLLSPCFPVYACILVVRCALGCVFTALVGLLLLLLLLLLAMATHGPLKSMSPVWHDGDAWLCALCVGY